MTPSKFSAKRSKPSYFFSILGVALVLIILGFLGWLAIYAGKLEQYFRESIEIQAFIRENTPANEVDSLKTYIATQSYARQVEYVSKEMAKDRFIKDGNEDWSRVLQYNPLPASIDFKVKSEYVNTDSLTAISRDIQQHIIVSEVKYPVAVVDKLNYNVRRAEVGLIIIVVLLGLIVILLIDNTIKLAMFSNRFLIKTMQMVGATRVFIAKPFDLKAVVNGLISAVIAIATIALLMFWAEQALPELKALRNNYLIGILFASLIFIGISITFISTHRSVVKYLKMKLDDLY